MGRGRRACLHYSPWSVGGAGGNVNTVNRSDLVKGCYLGASVETEPEFPPGAEGAGVFTYLLLPVRPSGGVAPPQAVRLALPVSGGRCNSCSRTTVPGLSEQRSPLSLIPHANREGVPGKVRGHDTVLLRDSESTHLGGAPQLATGRDGAFQTRTQLGFP